MKVLVKPRIHITLISMHTNGYRANGGIGFTLEEPKGILTIDESKSFKFNDKRKFHLTGNEIEQLEKTLNKAKAYFNLRNNISVILEGEIRTHHGMGSGTAIRLGCLEALLALNKIYPERENLISFSNRGGTSGIGINTYFDGGFIFDLGVSQPRKQFLPSSKAHNPSPPLVLQRVDMPDWKIGLCLPKALNTKTQEEEADFFRKACPINSSETYKVLYQSLFGAYASIREGNFKSFGESIIEIQKCEWKLKERLEYGPTLLEIENKLYKLGATSVGMSSLGPLLYFFAKDSAFNTIKAGINKQNCDLWVTSCSNSGRQIKF